MDCSDRYDSHDWGWDDGVRRCGRCGLVELAAERLKRWLLARLAEVGHVFDH